MPSGGRGSKPEPARPHTVAHSEKHVAVVFTVRLIRNDRAPLQDAEIRMRLPLVLPHQDIDALDVEGQPGGNSTAGKSRCWSIAKRSLLPAGC